MRGNRKLRLLLWLVFLVPFLFLLWTGITSQAESQPEGPQPYWVKNQWDLVFSEDFNNQALDQNKWVTCYWWASAGCTNQGNHELEWYQPGNVSIQNGTLQLTAEQQTVKGSDGKTYAYTSGMVTTGRTTKSTKYPAAFAFKYGFIEVRAWVPKGKGLWPAIWLLPADQQTTPEIDVMEIIGDDPKTVHMNFHYSNGDGSDGLSGGQWISPTDLTEGWHVFAVDWKPDHIDWYIDGVRRREFTQQNLIPAKPMYLIMNLAVGGDWPGSPDAQTLFPSVMKIDYVRVWKRGGDAELAPIADTFTDRTQPNKNFGGDPRLMVDSDPMQKSYLKFDLSPLSGKRIQSAWLRVMTTREPDAGSNNTQTLHVVPQINWDEMQLTWNNQPDLNPDSIGLLSQTESGVIYDIPLDTKTIQDHAGGILAIGMQSVYDDGLAVYSREFPSDGPRLIVTYASSGGDIAALIHRIENALHP